MSSRITMRSMICNEDAQDNRGHRCCRLFDRTRLVCLHANPCGVFFSIPALYFGNEMTDTELARMLIAAACAVGAFVAAAMRGGNDE